MMRQIKKQAPVFVAILFLFVIALGIGGYILSNQRFYLPGWVPVLGSEFYTVEAELQTGQAVVPGQGQTVNIAGVKIGEVGTVQLEDGKAVVELKIKDEYKPIYRDATVLLRPKTGLKDMYIALDPGNTRAGELPEGGRVQRGEHAAGREQRRVPRAARLRHARLPADPAERGRHGLRRRGHGRRPALSADRRAGPARGLQALRADGPRRQEDHAAAREAPQEHPARDPQLPDLLDRARAARQAARRAGGLRERELRDLRVRGGLAARGAPAVPGRARPDRADARQRPARLRPSSAPRSSGCARSRATSPRRCARRSRSSTRPRRSSATRSGPSPGTCSRRSATCAPPPTTWRS